MSSEETWRQYSGRDWGGDHYHFGDVSRHGWKKLVGCGGSSSSSSALPAANGVDDADRALLDLKVQRDQIVNHRRRMDSQASKDDEAARSMVKQGKKQQAMLALRKKKHHEQLALDCQTHLNRLEELMANIEFSQIQKDTVEALAEGVKMLKRVQKETGGVDYINQLMDDCDEATIQQQEISDALASNGVAADDADALAEYDRLIEAQAASQLAPTPAAAPATSAVSETRTPDVEISAPTPDVATTVEPTPAADGYPVLPTPDVEMSAPAAEVPVAPAAAAPRRVAEAA